MKVLSVIDFISDKEKRSGKVTANTRWLIVLETEADSGDLVYGRCDQNKQKTLKKGIKSVKSMSKLNTV